MSIFDINLRHIIVFNNVAETLNMTKSATNLFLSQPAVSLTIKELEKNFSVKLFIRKGKNLELTPEGKEFYIYTKRIFNLLQEAQSCMESFNALNKGSIKIGASTTIGNYLLPYILKIFKKEYPKIQVSIIISNSKKIIEMIKTCDIEVGLIEGPCENIDDKKIIIHKFIEDELIFFASPENPLSKKTPSIADLESEDFISREKGSGTRDIIEKNLFKYSINLKYTYIFPSSEAIKKAVICNLGFSALSKLILKNEIKHGTLKKIDVGNIKITRWFHLLEIGDHNKAKKVFVDFLFNNIENIKNFCCS